MFAAFLNLISYRDELDRETRNMAALLHKFRIDYSDVIVIPDITKKAEAATKEEFDNIVSNLPTGAMLEGELAAQREKTNR